MDRATPAAVAPQPAGSNDWYELPLTVGGACFTEPDDPATDYRGWTEIVTIEFEGATYDARDFPEGFVKAMERKVRS